MRAIVLLNVPVSNFAFELLKNQSQLKIAASSESMPATKNNIQINIVAITIALFWKSYRDYSRIIIFNSYMNCNSICRQQILYSLRPFNKAYCS